MTWTRYGTCGSWRVAVKVDRRASPVDGRAVATGDPFELSDDAPLRFGIALNATATASGSSPPPPSDLHERLDALCTALGDALGIRVEPQVARDYPALLDDMHSMRIDVAWLPPVLALRSASAGRALPVALPVRRGLSSFHTALFARAGTTLRRPADLVGVRAAWVDRNSASGYLVIRAALRAQGVDPAKAFGAEHFLGSHQAAVEAVLSGQCDVAATYLHHAPGGPGTWRAGWGDENVHILSRVGPIPADVIAAGIHTPVARIRAVQRALVGGTELALSAAAGRLLEADSFVAAESAHLEPLEKLLAFLEDTAYRWTSQFPPPLS